MKHLVVGGEGYIGQKLVSDLININNDEVISYDCIIYKQKKNSNFINKKLYRLINDSMGNFKKYSKILSSVDSIIILGGLVGDPITKKYSKIAKKINDFSNYQLIWQTGKKNYQKYNKLCRDFNNISVFDFIDRMDFAYSVADIIISRAGAIAITEICFLQKTSILIPSPYVSENHQMKNAITLAKKDACIILEEKDLELKLLSTLENLLNDAIYRQNIALNAKEISVDNSSIKIINVLNQIL